MTSHLTRYALAMAVATSLAVPSVALAATPKNGGYVTENVGTKTDFVFLGVTVSKGKVVGANGDVKFTAKGKLCKGPGATRPSPISVKLKAKKGVKPSADGSFSLTAKNQGPAKFTATVKGRFVTSTKAKFTFTASYKGCKGSFSTTKAKYQPLG